jgi:hypothetical protein
MDVHELPALVAEAVEREEVRVRRGRHHGQDGEPSERGPRPFGRAPGSQERQQGRGGQSDAPAQDAGFLRGERPIDPEVRNQEVVRVEARIPGQR